MSNTPEHGAPLRSHDLQRQSATQRRMSVALARRLSDAERSVDAARLALLAAEPPLPADTADGAGRVELFAPAVPGPGAELLGNVVVTARVLAQPAIIDPAPDGQGATALLQGEALFATQNDSATASFEARMEPAYLVEYNEVLVPFVAGDELTYRLYHDTGSDAYPHITGTTVLRFADERRFNGRIVLESRSRARYGGRYVHAAAGPGLYQTEWLSSGVVEASRLAGTAGTVRLDGVRAYGGVGGAVDLDDVTLEIDGAVVDAAASHAVGAESVLTVSAPISWEHAVSHVGLRLDYAA